MLARLPEGILTGMSDLQSCQIYRVRLKVYVDFISGWKSVLRPEHEGDLEVSNQLTTKGPSL